MTAVHTSIIVLTYRRVPALLAVLRALAPQCTPQHEVLIADDGSPEADVQALCDGLPAFVCQVRHVWHPDTGFTASRARNLAALHSVGQRLIFLDGDCVPQPHFLALHHRLQRPGEFVNGSRVLIGPALTAQVEAGAVDLGSASWWQWLRWRAHGDVNKLLHRWPWPSAPLRRQSRFVWKGIRSCNLALWRDDLWAVNGFDESFEGWGHEDADLVLRLHHQGLVRRNGFLATEVYHLWHRENARTQASKNRQTVLERSHTGQIQALQGLAQLDVGQDTRVRLLNSV